MLVSRVALQKPAGGVGETESSSLLGKPAGARLETFLAQNGEGDLETLGDRHRTTKVSITSVMSNLGTHDVEVVRHLL